MFPIIAPPVQIPEVPYYSQLQDIQLPEWRKIGCGVTSLAMLIDFYTTAPISLNQLLKEGIAAGAYHPTAGWKHHDLVVLAKKYGLEGNNYSFSNDNAKTAFGKLKNFVNEGPLIASIYYKFDPKNPLSHLIVIDAIDDTSVYYNDPSGKKGVSKISIDAFMKGWKKRIIIVRPQEKPVRGPLIYLKERNLL